MDIQIGKIVENKTLNYLFPVIRVYGSTFLAKFNLTHKLAYGIHDCVLEGTPYEYQRKICILIDRKSRPNFYEDFIRWIRLQEYFILDYSYDHTFTGRMQMVIIAIPEAYHNLYDSFLISQYSNMFYKDEIDNFFKEDTPTKQVLKRSSKAKENFIKLVNEKFSTELTIGDLEEKGELDFPWEKQNEFFNYIENKEEAL